MGLVSVHTLTLHCDVGICQQSIVVSGTTRDECKKKADKEHWFVRDNPSAAYLSHHGITGIKIGVGVAICPNCGTRPRR